jgi:uncharacterized protein
MPGEKKLDRLLKKMKPALNEGDYVFCTRKDMKAFVFDDIIMAFKEKEGITIILEQQVADRLQFEYSFVAKWITLTVHSSLEAVGLTAAFSKALTEENISCNVVAGYFHDHIFVNKKDFKKALIVLNKFSTESGNTTSDENHSYS